LPPPDVNVDYFYLRSPDYILETCRRCPSASSTEGH
jgi:hypothetical protein